MIKREDKTLHIITAFVIILSIIASATGLLYKTKGKAFYFINQYGNKVKICGNGLYAKDSIFKASTFRGTDFSILCAAVPILIIALILDVKKKTLKTRLFLMSVISLFLYYSASLAFGVTYNKLLLVYIGLFSSSLFGLIIAIGSIDKKQAEESMGEKLPFRGIYIFLVLTGAALFTAWLPDIITSLVKNRSLELIEVYTTEITYVLDMGVIAPTAFICLFQLKKRSLAGYILLEILLTVCTIVGIMLPMQTVFELSAGIKISFIQIVIKAASFVILAIFALYFNIRFFKNMKN